MNSVFIKAVGIWLAIVFAAFINGVFREKVLVPATGTDLALPLSGALLSILVFLITLALVPLMGRLEIKKYLWTGLLWVILTLFFEFIFGYFIAGKSWQEILQVFNIQKGDLFILVLFVTALSPWCAAKVRGIL